MSHALRFRFLLIIYLPISLQLRLATWPMTCAHCLSHETHGRGPRFLEPAEPTIAMPLIKRNYIVPLQGNLELVQLRVAANSGDKEQFSDVCKRCMQSVS